MLRIVPPNRLAWFSVLLDLSLIALAAYSIVEYVNIWAAVAVSVLLILVAVGVAKLARRLVLASDGIKRRLDSHPVLNNLLRTSSQEFLSRGLIIIGQLVGNRVVDNSSNLSEGFVQAFEVVSSIAIVLIVISIAFEHRSHYLEMRKTLDYVAVRKKMAVLKRQLSPDDQRWSNLSSEQRDEIIAERARIFAKHDELENGTIEQLGDNLMALNQLISNHEERYPWLSMDGDVNRREL